MTVLITVCDTGIGIEHGQKDHIFGVFNQENNTVSERFGGTGLGLAISKQLCELMNGYIDFHSEKGKGSSFEYSIPFLKDTGAFSDRELLANQHISVLCDKENECQLMVSALTRLGADVHLTLNPETTIVIIDKESEAQHAFYDNVNIKALSNNIEIVELKRPQDLSNDYSGSEKRVLFKPFSILTFLKLLNIEPVWSSSRQKSLSLEYSKEEHEKQLKKAKLNLLIVDDNDINLEIMTGLVEGVSEKVFTAKNGKQALQMLNRSTKSSMSFDIILMDCNMPVMDGLECTKRIRDGEAGEKYKHISIVAVTADAMLGDVDKCLAAGMDAYLSKPIISQSLFSTLLKLDRQTSRPL